MKLLNDNTGRKKTEACGMTKDQMIEAMRKINAKYNDNLEERKNALKILMGGIPVGNKVLFLWKIYTLMIPISGLFIIM